MDQSLSEERKLVLQEKFFEFGFNNKKPDKVFFDAIDDAIEYHYIASIYNWDDGVEVLAWIVNNSVCDKGTAKMIFWRSQPSYYTRFLTQQEAQHDFKVFTLVRSIIDNFEKGFYKNQNIFYDPRNDPSAEETDYKDPKAKWEIPSLMKDPSPGKEINFE